MLCTGLCGAVFLPKKEIYRISSTQIKIRWFDFIKKFANLPLALPRIRYLEQPRGTECRTQSNSNRWIAFDRYRKNFWRRSIQCSGDRKWPEFVAHNTNILCLLSPITMAGHPFLVFEERSEGLRVRNVVLEEKLKKIEKTIGTVRGAARIYLEGGSSPGKGLKTPSLPPGFAIEIGISFNFCSIFFYCAFLFCICEGNWENMQSDNS